MTDDSLHCFLCNGPRNLYPVHGRSSAPGFRRIRWLCEECRARFCSWGDGAWEIRPGDDPGDGVASEKDQLSLGLGEDQ